MATKTITRNKPLAPCPLCGTPVVGGEIINVYDPSTNPFADKWMFNVRFTAACEKCFCKLDVIRAFQDENLNIGEAEAEEFLRSEERLWNREEN